MALRLYFDHNVRRPVCEGLRLRDVDVLTALEDGAHQLSDPELLDRVTALGRVLFTQDDDFLAEADHRQREGLAFSGVIYAHQESLTIGDCISQLELLAKVSDPEELHNQVVFLPLK